MKTFPISSPLLRTVTLMGLVILGWGMTGGTAAAQGDIQWLIRGNGGRVDWGPGGWIAWDAAGPDGYTDVWIGALSGGTRQNLTADHPVLPQLHNGQPAWHPSGRFIVFQSLDPAIKAPLAGRMLYRLVTAPGGGVHNNIWVMRVADGEVWQVTDVGKGKGVLHPHFSGDGKKLVWSEMIEPRPQMLGFGLGKWQIAIADIDIASQRLRVSNIRRRRPGEMHFYETHGFSPDGRKIIFTATARSDAPQQCDIYTCDLSTGQVSLLTDDEGEHWDEHGAYSPDGANIIWMSSRGIDGLPRQLTPLNVRTDYWIMDADGSNKKRLTFFNQPGSTHYLGGRSIASDFSWSPAGDAILFFVQHDPTRKNPGSIGILKLNPIGIP